MIYKLSQYDLVLASPPEPEYTYQEWCDIKADAAWIMQDIIERCKKEKEESE